jgi:sulfatase modifying factor 1
MCGGTFRSTSSLSTAKMPSLGGRARWVVASVFAIGVIGFVGGAYALWLRPRVDRPKYPLPPDDPRCPHAMAYVPAGTGRLHEDAYKVATERQELRRSRGPDGEARVSDVVISAFCMDRNEVTVADYGTCVREGRCAAPKHDDTAGPCNYEEPLRAEHPMNCVTYNEASAYCAAQGKRLPLADEWEYAAQGGEAHFEYPWGGDDAADRSCVDRDKTCAVRSFVQEALGLFDMSGNVVEYTQFSCAGKPCLQEPDALNAPISGGCWDCSSGKTMAKTRAFTARTWGTADNGFRCAK